MSLTLVKNGEPVRALPKRLILGMRVKVWMHSGTYYGRVWGITASSPRKYDVRLENGQIITNVSEECVSYE